jgi:hypothetical protein
VLRLGLCRHNVKPGTPRCGAIFPWRDGLLERGSVKNVKDGTPGGAPYFRGVSGALDPVVLTGVSEASATAIRPTNFYSTQAYPTLAKMVRSVLVKP